MKKILLGIISIAGLVVFASPPGVLRSNVVFQIVSQPGRLVATNITFHIYSSTNVNAPVSSWSLVASMVATNNRTNYMSFPMSPGARFFVCTESNYWGQGDFSNVALTPLPPQSDSVLSIGP